MEYKSTIACILLLSLSIMVYTQNKGRPEPIQISDTLSYDQFREIKQFVLDKRYTQTYCNMYNDNPYYAFEDEGDTIDLYLNPIVQLLPEVDLKDVDKYNVIALRTQNITSVDIYANSKNREVYLTSYYDTDQSLKEKTSKIVQYIKHILSEIEKDKKRNSKTN